MATFLSWSSDTSALIALPGLAYVVGWTGGYVLLLILMAGQIRKYGKYTAADFIGDQFA